AKSVKIRKPSRVFRLAIIPPKLPLRYLLSPGDSDEAARLISTHHWPVERKRGRRPRIEKSIAAVEEPEAARRLGQSWLTVARDGLYKRAVARQPKGARDAVIALPLEIGRGESGGTGRRARLRISWATVGVQVPPLAPTISRTDPQPSKPEPTH